MMLNFDLPARNVAHLEHPRVIDEFLRVCDDPASYPILLHCKAGLHRTGLLTAIYRIEYELWNTADALRELRANGFGDSAATSANDYVYAFLAVYQPRWLRAMSLFATSGRAAAFIDVYRPQRQPDSGMTGKLDGETRDVLP
jgi:hypothetical protein